ncbi:unnamed protein product [Prorocentrum cordatum]|uniref:Uncharacterized protein n=1 Tax=Prorocentrum cordatum TaxID=2364126 RepID=A0ABN9RV57_9DINO|nr:unnamed protein product [Polarella glacialis]
MQKEFESIVNTIVMKADGKEPILAKGGGNQNDKAVQTSSEDKQMEFESIVKPIVTKDGGKEIETAVQASSEDQQKEFESIVNPIRMKIETAKQACSVDKQKEFESIVKPILVNEVEIAAEVLPKDFDDDVGEDSFGETVVNADEVCYEKRFGEPLQSCRDLARVARQNGADPFGLIGNMLDGLPPEQRARAEAALQPRRARRQRR